MALTLLLINQYWQTSTWRKSLSGPINMSIGPMKSDLALFGGMSFGSPLPVTMVTPESSEKLVNDMMLNILYQQRSIAVTDRWFGAAFMPMVLVDGTVDQDKHINILAQNYHPWSAQLCQQEDKDFIFQDDGTSWCSWRLDAMVKGKPPNQELWALAYVKPWFEPDRKCLGRFG